MALLRVVVDNASTDNTRAVALEGFSTQFLHGRSVDIRVITNGASASLMRGSPALRRRAPMRSAFWMTTTFQIRISSRMGSRLLNRILARILPNAMPDDALCLLIRREETSETEMARNTSRVHL
jgi:hypothetical protein